jgi:hypothetical protein
VLRIVAQEKQPTAIKRRQRSENRHQNHTGERTIPAAMLTSRIRL